MEYQKIQTSSFSCIRANAKAASLRPSFGRPIGLNEVREIELASDACEGDEGDGIAPLQGRSAWLLDGLLWNE